MASCLMGLRMARDPAGASWHIMGLACLSACLDVEWACKCTARTGAGRRAVRCRYIESLGLPWYVAHCAGMRAYARWVVGICREGMVGMACLGHLRSIRGRLGAAGASWRLIGLVCLRLAWTGNGNVSALRAQARAGAGQDSYRVLREGDSLRLELDSQ